MRAAWLGHQMRCPELDLLVLPVRTEDVEQLVYDVVDSELPCVDDGEAAGLGDDADEIRAGQSVLARDLQRMNGLEPGVEVLDAQPDLPLLNRGELRHDLSSRQYHALGRQKVLHDLAKGLAEGGCLSEGGKGTFRRAAEQDSREHNREWSIQAIHC